MSHDATPSPANAPILVIDDDRNTVVLLKAVLERAGHSVVAADGGARGLELLRERDYDAILLDLAMPRPDGFEVLNTLEQEKPSLLPRILVVTAVTAQQWSELDISRLGGLIQKPFDLRGLLTAVRGCVERSAGGDGHKRGK